MTQAALAPPEERTCRVALDVFNGPLDLLLSLVRDRQLDIATVPLAMVADQYFAYVSAMDTLDLEVAADYLVVAATLVFLKSKSLLPPIPAAFREEGEESPEVVEGRLRERLIAYSRYRDAGDTLRARASEAAAFFYRDGGDVASAFVQRYRIAASRLADALVAAMRSAKPEQRMIVRERVSLLEQMELVRRAVAAGEASFVDLCGELDRYAIVVTFLAVLELIRRGRIAFRQEHPFGDVLLRTVAEETLAHAS